MIIGDGQRPLLSLIEYLKGNRKIEDVPSLLYRYEGRVISNKREFYSIKQLSPPDFSDLSLSFYRTKPKDILPLPYQISRGCSYDCNFCTYRAIEPKIELSPIEKVISDIKYMKDKYQSNHFSFITAAVNLSYDYLNNLCDAIVDKELDILWNANARLDNLDINLLYKMKKAGCEKLYFGLESASNRVLERMGKKIKVEQTIESLINTYNTGISSVLNIMYGLPYEKEEDILDTVRFLKKYNRYIDKTSFNQFMLMAGSPISNAPDRYGLANLRRSKGEFDTRFIYFAFDEIEGLKWEEKLRQTKRFEKILLENNFKYIIRNKYPFFRFVPFFVYYYWRNGIKAPYKSYFSIIVARLWPLVKRLNDMFR
jgi:radical SAM superfamily enzyme YgiQ (UPF0313 family)